MQGDVCLCGDWGQDMKKLQETVEVWEQQRCLFYNDEAFFLPWCTIVPSLYSVSSHINQLITNQRRWQLAPKFAKVHHIYFHVWSWRWGQARQGELFVQLKVSQVGACQNLQWTPAGRQTHHLTHAILDIRHSKSSKLQSSHGEVEFTANFTGENIFNFSFFIVIKKKSHIKKQVFVLNILQDTVYLILDFLIPYSRPTWFTETK